MVGHAFQLTLILADQQSRNVPIFMASATICFLFFGWRFSLDDVDHIGVIGPPAVIFGIWSCYLAAKRWRTPNLQQHPMEVHRFGGGAGAVDDVAQQV